VRCRAFFASIVVFCALGKAGADAQAPPSDACAPQFVWLDRVIDSTGPCNMVLWHFIVEGALSIRYFT
jgi:hypothetical protein